MLSLLGMVTLCLSSFAKADNSITIDQTGGNYFNLNIEQVGANNTIKMYDSSSYIYGNNVNINLIQYNDSGTTNTIALWHLAGNSNTVRWAQGYAWDTATSTTYSYDGQEGGGHYARIDIHGNNNTLVGHQTNQGSTSGHTFTSLIFSDYNDIWIRQQHDGAKTVNLTTYTDYNDVTIRQKGTGANHTASITLNGSYPTTLDLLQQGSTTQSYSLSQNCLNTAGCSISIIQGQ